MTKRKTTGSFLRLMGFTAEPGARWDQEVFVAELPATWTSRVAAHLPRLGPDRSPRTQGLAELLCGVDPAVIHVSIKWPSISITAFAGADQEVLKDAFASWAAVATTADVDWYAVFDPEELRFESRTLNLLECCLHDNGTASPASHVFNVLPTFLAKQVVEQGLDMFGGQGRAFILGPPHVVGRREAVLWPPQKLDVARGGSGWVTAKIQFHVETAPNCPELRIHADLSITRFPITRVTWVPQRGDGDAGATIWLHAPRGFLGRDDEPHTLLASSVVRNWHENERKWRWKPGLARVLARLTNLRFPDPQRVFDDPAQSASPQDEHTIRAYVVYSEGTKLAAQESQRPDERPNRAKSLLHAAKTGLVPADHIAVHRSLAELFAPLGIRRLPDYPRMGSVAKLEIHEDTNVYPLELYTQSEQTRGAVLAALEHKLGLKRTPDRRDPSIVTFKGDLTVKVRLYEAASISAGVTRAPNSKDFELLRRHARRVEQVLGACPEPRAAVVELEGAQYFDRANLVDPKSAMKQAFARTDRRLQCVRPIKPFTPPKSWPEKSKRKRPEAFPGTNYGLGEILRATAAIEDGLRQLGRIGRYELPAEFSGFEQVGIYLHQGYGYRVPIAIRLSSAGKATVHLWNEDPAPYADAPKLLASEKGRIPNGSEQKKQVASFLTNVLGIKRDSHDRVVMVSANNLRAWGWRWLQDQHVTPDRLLPPGADMNGGVQTSLAPSATRGLRVIRLREPSSSMEITRGFTHDPELHAPRVHGLFKASERLFYALNPRPDQMQTPLSLTKLDPAILSNFAHAVANPLPLELLVAHMQPGDDASKLAMLVAQLRRSYLHTEQDTLFPCVLHLCTLASEYI